MSMVKTARKELGLSQIKMALWINDQPGIARKVTQNQVSKWENKGRLAGVPQDVRDVCAPIALKASLRDAYGREPTLREIEIVKAVMVY